MSTGTGAAGTPVAGTPAMTSSMLWSAAQFGGLAGLAGTAIGGAAAVTRTSSTPTLFAVASGIQCFVLGSSYWAVRSSILTRSQIGAQGQGEVAQSSPRRRLEASTIAGGVSGITTAALFRGRKNVVPGAIMFSLFGLVGQSLYNVLDARHARPTAETEAEGFWHKLVHSRYNPVKSLSDEEYEAMLMGKLGRVEAEMALVDEDLAKLRRQDKETDG